MKKEEYEQIEGHMLSLMNDSAHDAMHIYRVLGIALLIARSQAAVDYDILIAACLLHDIGRQSQNENPSIDHAVIGGEMAYEYLRGIGWGEQRAKWVQECVQAHRYRSGVAPSSIEAKILFDSDKLDVSGAMGVARTLLYEGNSGEAMYLLDEDAGVITGGGGAEPNSFFQEFNFKLRGIYDRFYTDAARELALQRKQAALSFYDSLLLEAEQTHQEGRKELERRLG